MMLKEWQCPRCNAVNSKPDYVLRLARLRESLDLIGIGTSTEPAPRCSQCDYEAGINALLDGKYDTREEKIPAPASKPKEKPLAALLDKPAKTDRPAQIVVGVIAAVLVCGMCALTIGGGIYLSRTSGKGFPSASLTPTGRVTQTAKTPKGTAGQTTDLLAICLVGEPTSLLIYADDSRIADLVRQTVMDGPIDQIGYELQPVILKKLPSFENGDVQIKSVTVNEGDMVMDAYGIVQELKYGTQLMDLGGRVFTYQGGETQASQFEVTFRLREDISWSDGTPLTARDSYFSYEVASDPSISTGNVGAYFTENTQEYRVVDDQTLVWSSIPGYRSMQPYDGFFLPLPEHAYGEMTPTELLEDEAANFKPLSLGAYVVEEWIAGDHVTFKPNPHYFRASEGLPWVESLTFLFYDNPDQILDDLLAGKCDATLSDSFSFEYRILQRFEELRRAEKDGKLAIRYAPNGLEHLAFNITPSEEYYRPLGNDLFESTSLRQAFAYCIDRVTLIEEHYAGLGPPPDSYLPFDHPYHANGLPSYEFDPPTGQKILEALGWVDEDGDGIRKRYDEKLSITYQTTVSPLRQEIGAEVVRMLHENCGVDVTLMDMPSSEFFDGVLKGEYDIAQFAWLYMYDGDVAPCDIFHDKQNNYLGYNNPDYSRECFGALTEQDADLRAEHIYETQRILLDELPFIPLFMREWFGIARADLQNFTVHPGTPQFQEIESYFIKP